jgi:gas vesicle protein GvpA/GvpJ/GvpM family
VRRKEQAMEILESADQSLLDVIDHVLNKGVLVSGEAMLGVAGVDLVYLRLNALLCAADRVQPRARKK